MATVSVQSVNYTVTQADVNQGWCVIPVLWRSETPNANYGAAWGVEDRDSAIDLDYFTGDMHNKTAAGFDAIVYMYSPGYGSAGDKLVVNAMGLMVQ
jgi:hypothetical protein